MKLLFKENKWGLSLCLVLFSSSLAYVFYLQHLFYLKTGPFYDSLAYYNQLAGVLSSVREKGFFHSLFGSCMNSTVALPWIQTCFLGLFTTKPRLWMGPLLQSPWIFSFFITLYFYFRYVHRENQVMSFLFASLFIINAGVFYWNRGWSDFAMDLMQYVILGNALLFYLFTCRFPFRINWVLAGLFLGFACLYRSTALVYVVLILAPVLVIRCYREWQTIRLLMSNIGWTGLAFILTCGWFYVLNYSCLYYYYVVWNPDANAHLPLRDSIKHLQFLINMHVGRPLFFLLLVWMALTVIKELFQQGGRMIFSVNWLYLWIGCVPVGFLVLRGAGLNPFVCMPSMFGLLLFVLEPVQSTAAARRYEITTPLVAIACLAIWFSVWKHAYRNDVAGVAGNPVNSLMQVVQDVKGQLINNSQKDVRICIPSVGYLCNASFAFALVYRENAIQNGSDGANMLWCGKSITFYGIPDLGHSSKISKRNAGTLDPTVSDQILSQDYLVLITPDVMDKFESTFSNPTTNLLVRTISKLAVEHGFLATGDPVLFSRSEKVMLYERHP